MSSVRLWRHSRWGNSDLVLTGNLNEALEDPHALLNIKGPFVTWCSKVCLGPNATPVMSRTGLCVSPQSALDPLPHHRER